MDELFRTRFRALLEKHGLKDKATIHERQDGLHYRLTLYRIADEEKERDVPLPPAFVRDAEKLTRKYFDKRSILNRIADSIGKFVF